MRQKLAAEVNREQRSSRGAPKENLKGSPGCPTEELVRLEVSFESMDNYSRSGTV